MATKPLQRPASPAELARAVVRGLTVNRLQMRASPPQGDPLAFLQAQLFQYTSSPNYAIVHLGTYINAAAKPFVLLHGVRQLCTDVFQFHVQPNIGILESILVLLNLRKNALASF